VEQPMDCVMVKDYNPRVGKACREWESVRNGHK
jgi:hypothetical protein